MNSVDGVEKIIQIFEEVKRKNPLVQCITNTVTINDCANALLAIGASPVMADGHEAAEMAEIADSLVINIGTLNESTEKAMKSAATVASRRGIPIILDPVGAGSTPTRLRLSRELIEQYPITIVRGNWSEIKALKDGIGSMKGVDSCKKETMKIEELKEWARDFKTILAVTGKEDLITDGKQLFRVKNGCSKMQQITGTGCMSTTLCGAYATCTNNMFWGAVSGTAVMSLAGELAGRENGIGSGTLRTQIINELNLMNDTKLKQEGRFEYEV